MLTLAELVGRSDRDSRAPISVARCNDSGTVDALVAGLWPNGRPVGVDDRFYGASLAKQVTGAALAALVRDGLLDPDLPVATYIGGLPPWSADVTPRRLANHTAGLPPAGELEARTPGHWTEDFALGALADLLELPTPPGSAYGYSNLGYVLLARIIAEVSGMPFAQFAAARLFAPLKIEGIGFLDNPATQPQLPLMGRKLPLTHGDGGLWSTASAFARWLHLQNRDALGVVAIVEAPGQLMDGGTSAYGWGLGLRTYRGHRLLIHAGEWTGCAAKAVRCPDLGIGVVVLAAATRFEAVDRLVLNILDDAASGS